MYRLGTKWPLPPPGPVGQAWLPFPAPDREPNVWRWQFRVGDKVATGKTATALRGIAARRPQIKIDEALRKSKGDRQYWWI